MKTNSSSKCYMALNAPHGEFMDVGPAFLIKKEEGKWCKVKNKDNKLGPAWEWYLKEIELR
ncbi:MAG: hypothetical protein OEM28_03430 [Nitrosopumilus sp.]|nr:hypothetical protein [Nitrosopumilus sp.]MDH3487408.1 hypothetical protein [Nitrosopumilus sp.]